MEVFLELLTVNHHVSAGDHRGIDGVDEPRTSADQTRERFFGKTLSLVIFLSAVSIVIEKR